MIVEKLPKISSSSIWANCLGLSQASLGLEHKGNSENRLQRLAGVSRKWILHRIIISGRWKNSSWTPPPVSCCFTHCHRFLPDFFLFLIGIPTTGGSSQFESQYLRWYFPVFMGTWIKPFGGLAKMENITTFSLGIPPVPVSHLPTWRMRRARSKGDASLPGGSPGAGFSGQIHGLHLAFWWIWWLNYPKLGVSAIWRYLLEFLEAPVKPL